MKNKNNAIIYITVILITILLMSMLSVYASATYKSSKATGFTQKISAKASVIYEPTNNVFIYEKNGNERLPMASTTKIMTAMVVVKNCDVNETVVIGPESVGIEGSSAYLREGDEYTVLELLYALLLQSANDAATALAYYTAGGIEEFADLMNSEASRIGLENTHFTNPHGLDNDNHYTTANDLAILGANLIKSDVLRKIVSTYKKTFTYGERTRTYINHNKLLSLYDGAIGIKTGFTKRSGRCLVSAAEKNGLTFITVTLNAPSDWNDHIALLNYAFDTYEKIHLASVGDYCHKVKVIGGNKPNLLIATNEDLSIVKEKDGSVIKEYFSLPNYLIAPINKGDVVGKVVYNVNGKTYTINLVATENVSYVGRKNIFENFLRRFHNKGVTNGTD